MKKILFILFCINIFMQSQVFAKTFNVENEVKKCQKCHGINLDKQVLNVTKKISNFSKKELIESFEKYLNSPKGGKAGLMKIIIKKYSKDEREKIADYIYRKNY